MSNTDDRHPTREGAQWVHTWTEGLALWRRLDAIPGLHAVAVMPTHIHALSRRDVRSELLIVMRAYARWRNAHRDTPGEAVWRALEPPSRPKGPQKQRRDDRYIHLNPCRAHLVACPLDWALSSHRDATGLSISVRHARRDAVAYHAYVSKDEHTSTAGTRLPDGTGLERFDASALMDVFDAVSAVHRCTDEELRIRGPARSLFLRSARLLTVASGREIGEVVGVRARAVQMVKPKHDRASRLVSRVAGDPRFRHLPAHIDLRPWFRRHPYC